jgi:hypothetical protein
VNGNGSGKDGFSGGQISTQEPRTVVTPDWLNAQQEEVANSIELFFTLSKPDNTQLRQTFERLLDNSIAAHLAGTASSAVGMTSRGDAGTGIMMDAVSDDAQTIACVYLQTSNQVYSSTDGGATFASRSLGSASANRLKGVAWSPALSLFCAVGESGEIQTSPDAVTWTKRTPGSSYAGNFNAVQWSDAHAKFIAVGDDGEVQTSSNGTAWTRLATSAGIPYRVLAVKGSTVVAISGTSDVFRSTDLIAFTVTGMSSGGIVDASESQGMGVVGDSFVTVTNFNATNTQRLIASIDGVRWRTIASWSGTGTVRTSSRGQISRSGSIGWELVVGKAGDSLVWGNARPTIGAAGRNLIRTKVAWVGEDNSSVLYCSPLTP